MKTPLRDLPSTFSYRDARRAGLSKYAIYRMRAEGRLVPLGAGLYRRKDAERAVAELLLHCSGLDGLLHTIIDFTVRTMSFEYVEVFPRCVPLAGDGCGNFWVLDVSPEGAPVAPVFFACHDPPVVLYQAPSLAVFLTEVVRKFRPPHRSLVDDVCEDRLIDVWRKNPGTMTVVEAKGGDQVLQEFATTLDDRFQIVDLRAAPTGMGFSSGRYGPATEVRRHGDHRLFAYAAPVRRGLWARLTGRA